jgi:hypothetical protein
LGILVESVRAGGGLQSFAISVFLNWLKLRIFIPIGSVALAVLPRPGKDILIASFCSFWLMVFWF